MRWLLPLVCCAGALGFRGPPLAYEELTPAEQAVVQEAAGLAPLPGKEILHYPEVDIHESHSPHGHDGRLQRWQLVERIQPVRAVRPVSVDDLEKLSRREQPPLEFAFPVEFTEYDRAEGRLEEALQAAAVPVAVPAAVPQDAGKPPSKGLVSWLPQRVQSWLPSLPSLSSFIPHLPSYLPGFEFEAEVHRQPIRVPHIPTPSELLKDVNSVLDRALQGLHRKQEQLIELVKCTCPRPARCETLFQEFLSVGGKPDASAAASPAGPAEPSVSLFTELTKPNGGHGASFGFFVDKAGPHLGHHVHNPAGMAGPPAASAPTSASASATASASASASEPTSASASTPTQAQSSTVTSATASTGSRSSASAPASATASDSSSASASATTEREWARR